MGAAPTYRIRNLLSDLKLAGKWDVVWQGGKVLRGPQSSGLMIGKRAPLKDAQANASPNGGIGRPMKVGKEEQMGLLAAVR